MTHFFGNLKNVFIKQQILSTTIETSTTENTPQTLEKRNPLPFSLPVRYFEDQIELVKNEVAKRQPVIKFFKLTFSAYNYGPFLETDQISHQFINAFLTSSKDVQLILSPDDFYLLIIINIWEFITRDKKISISPEDVGMLTDLMPILSSFNLSKNYENGEETNWNTLVEPFSTSSGVTCDVLGLREPEKRISASEVRRVKKKTSLKSGLVFLEGSPEDWSSLLEKVQILYDLLSDFQWYLIRICQLLSKISISLSGTLEKKKKDKEFWRSIMKVPDESTLKVSGWFLDFCAYIQWPSGARAPNLKLQPDEMVQRTKFEFPAVITKDFLDTNSFVKRTTKVVSGFMGVANDKEEGFIRPVIGWAKFAPANPGD